MVTFKSGQFARQIGVFLTNTRGLKFDNGPSHPADPSILRFGVITSRGFAPPGQQFSTNISNGMELLVLSVPNCISNCIANGKRKRKELYF